MLTQQRHEIILKLLKEKGSITVTEVRDLLDTSESTVRRDITALDKEGKLEKVFGGAVEAGQKVTAHDYTVEQKNELNLSLIPIWRKSKNKSVNGAPVLHPNDLQGRGALQFMCV